MHYEIQKLKNNYEQKKEFILFSCTLQTGTWQIMSERNRSKLASAAGTFICLVFPGSPPEGGLGLVGFSGSWRSSVLAAGTLLRADLPRRHTRGGQSDDTLSDCVSLRDVLVNIMFPTAWRVVWLSAGSLGLTGWSPSGHKEEKASLTCSSVTSACEHKHWVSFPSTHHVKIFFFLFLGDG